MASAGGTRVFKKSSPNGKITAYLGKRDYVDHITQTDPIDGVVLIDPEYLRGKKVFAKLLCAFRYGREDLDVLGLTFRKDFYTATKQVYPPENDDEKKPKTRLQERLMKKLGSNAYPFFIEIPAHSPCSVTLQPAPGDTGKPCGVDYELKTYVAEEAEDKLHKRNSVRLAIRKVQYAPDKQGPQPTGEIRKDFLMSDKPLCLEASLDKELYYHGETINVNVQVTNNSSKTVKKIKIFVRQFADICLFSSAQYKCPVASIEADDQVAPSSTLCKVYQICPILSNNKDKRGLALDGQLKHEDTNLASSTIIKDGVPRENLGIIVQYKVKVKLVIGGLGGECSLELPVTLMHPMPEPEIDSKDDKSLPTSECDKTENQADQALEPNLISFDSKEPDDIVFEDFARMRLKGDPAETT
ncbi:beta-arrestin-1-like isoform X1 [Styela clava]|uniref:beta-arrestin-1-like isoform X1 n=1 Tax=Styela clava TaxID=7725 RepID=UPI00193A2799|nr:beta-arrestin-1-like isoform X1 [Styela clava]